MTVIALAFDAIHAESFFQHIQAMPCANTMNMRSGFGIACLIPHSVVLRQSGIYPVFPHPIDDKHAPLDAPWTGAKKPPSKGVTSLTNTNALSNLSAFRASDQVSTLCDRTTRAFLMNRGSRGRANSSALPFTMSQTWVPWGDAPINHLRSAVQGQSSTPKSQQRRLQGTWRFPKKKQPQRRAAKAD